MQTLFAVQRVSAISISEIVSSIANTVCESSCVQIDSTPNAVDPAHTAATVQFAVSARQCPLHAGREGPGPLPWEGVLRACGGICWQGHGMCAGCALGGLQAKRAWSRAGATTEQPQSDHGAITERPRSGAERLHRAAPRFPMEPLRGTRTELLRAPPRGAAHGAGTEQLREAACISGVRATICAPRGGQSAPAAPSATVDSF